MRLLQLLLLLDAAAAFHVAECGVSWTQHSLSGLDTALSRSQMPVLNGSLWLVAGQLYSTLADSNAVYYSADGASWETALADGAAPFSARQPGPLPVLDGVMYLLGGYSAPLLGDATCLADQWASPDGRTWTNITSPDAPVGGRYKFGVAAFQGLLVVMGGAACADASDTFNDVWTLDPATGLWARQPDAGWSPRYAPAVAVSGDALFVLGGSTSAHTASSEVWRALNLDAWERLSSAYPCGPGLPVVVLGDGSLAAPICANDSASNSFAAASATGARWTACDGARYVPQLVAAAAMGDELYVLYATYPVGDLLLRSEMSVEYAWGGDDDDDGGLGGVDTALLIGGAVVCALVGWLLWHRRRRRRQRHRRSRSGAEQPLLGTSADEARWAIGPGRLVKGRLLGRGGAGSVFLGTLDGAPCAIKRVMIARHELEDRRDRYVTVAREAETLFAISHPNVLRFFGICRAADEEAVYFVTELASRSLQDLIDDAEEPLEHEARVRIALQLAQGLQYLHTVGIIHRDIKPDNVLLSAAGDVRIADFSESRRALAASVDPASSADRATRVVGTMGFLAPELISDQGSRQHLARALDVFSFGVVLNCLSTREWPFARQLQGLKNPSFGIARLLDSGERPDQSAAAPDWWNELIRDCWAQEPAERPSFEDIVDALYSGGAHRQSLGVERPSLL